MTRRSRGQRSEAGPSSEGVRRGHSSGCRSQCRCIMSACFVPFFVRVFFCLLVRLAGLQCGSSRRFVCESGSLLVRLRFRSGGRRWRVSRDLKRQRPSERICKSCLHSSPARRGEFLCGHLASLRYITKRFSLYIFPFRCRFIL